MKRCLLYGDSNTYGANPENLHKGGRYEEEKRFTYMLSEKLKAEWEFVVEAKVGRCIPSMEFEFEEFGEILKKAGNIDLFAVMLGTNDYLSYSKPDAERVAKRMRAFLEKVRAESKAEILMIAPPCLDFTGDRYYGKFTTLDGGLSLALKNVAAEFGIFFADAGSVPLSVAKDGIHLTEEAQPKLAEYLAEVFMKI